MFTNIAKTKAITLANHKGHIKLQFYIVLLFTLLVLLRYSMYFYLKHQMLRGSKFCGEVGRVGAWFW